jgi:exonuclease VII small subunit
MPAWLSPELESVLYRLERQLQNWHEGMQLAPFKGV